MRKDLFDELVGSVKQMKAIEVGRLEPGHVTRAEEAALRARFNLSQAQFARLLGICFSTLPELGAKSDDIQRVQPRCC